jgi:integrase
MDFLVKHYGEIPVADFNVACLNLLRTAIIQSRRFCREGINDYVRRIVTLFKWGVSVGQVDPITAWGLATVKPLEPGHPSTFDHPEREYVTDDVIIATLPLLPPTLQAMIKLQRLTGMRPSEVFNMLVGDIDTASVQGIWLYRLASHKTQKKTGKRRVLPLNATEQALIAPYLIGKKATDSVFNPKTARCWTGIMQGHRWDTRRRQ